MAFRTGETREFPFDRDDRKVWYALIEYDITGFHETAYTSSKSGKSDLLAMLIQLRGMNRLVGTAMIAINHMMLYKKVTDL